MKKNYLTLMIAILSWALISCEAKEETHADRKVRLQIEISKRAGFPMSAQEIKEYRREVEKEDSIKAYNQAQ